MSTIHRRLRRWCVVRLVTVVVFVGVEKFLVVVALNAGVGFVVVMAEASELVLLVVDGLFVDVVLLMYCLLLLLAEQLCAVGCCRR